MGGKGRREKGKLVTGNGKLIAEGREEGEVEGMEEWEGVSEGEERREGRR